MSAGSKPLLARNMVRQAAIADAIILGPFAIPFLAPEYVAFWSMLDRAIGGAGIDPLPPAALLLASILGLFVLLASALRLATPNADTALWAGLAKSLAVVLLAIGLLHDAPRIFAVPLVADSIVGALLLYTARRENWGMAARK